MTITTVYAGTNDGVLTSTHATYATAVAGGATVTGPEEGGSTSWVGQQFATPNYLLFQLFFSFDTSSIPDTDTVSGVVFSLDGNSDESTTDFDMTALNYSWGTTGNPATSNWRTDAQLQALTSLATFNSSGYSVDYMDFTSAGAAFNSHINKTGYTAFVVVSSRNISATQPSGNERIRVSMANVGGTTVDPKLVITHAAASLVRSLIVSQAIHRASSY